MGESPEGGRRLPRRKQYGIWLRLLVKRLWRQPAYLLLLVLLPVLGCAVSAVEQEEKSGAAVAVCVADGSWAAQITDGLRAQEADSVLTYVCCGDEAETEDKRRDKPASETWEIRKQETIEHLKDMPRDVKIIALADKTANAESLVREYRLVGDKLWEKFNQTDKQMQEWYFRKCAEALEEFSDTNVMKTYLSYIDELFE